MKTKTFLPAGATPALPLASITAGAVFPGRTALYPREVAEALAITEQQVIDLITEGSITAVNISSGLQTQLGTRATKAPRRHWRIPVSAYDAFINSRQSACCL